MILLLWPQLEGAKSKVWGRLFFSHHEELQHFDDFPFFFFSSLSAGAAPAVPGPAPPPSFPCLNKMAHA